MLKDMFNSAKEKMFLTFRFFAKLKIMFRIEV